MIPHVPVVVLLATGVVILLSISALMLLREARERELNERIERVVYGTDRQFETLTKVRGWLHAIGSFARRFYKEESLDSLRGVIRAAGMNPHRVLPVVLGAKLILAIAVPIISAISAYVMLHTFPSRILMMCGGFGAGILGPEMILSFIKKRFSMRIQAGLPDALDLMVICSEAGMGLESALARVSQEMRLSNAPMATVLMGLLDDLRALPNRADAYANLGKFDIPNLRRMGMMLNQSMQYGTPLGMTLRAIADELRRERRNKLEEKAAKLPVKLTFPMILCIMPCLWIIAMGSSFLHLMDALASAATQH